MECVQTTHLGVTSQPCCSHKIFFQMICICIVCKVIVVFCRCLCTCMFMVVVLKTLPALPSLCLAMFSLSSRFLLSSSRPLSMNFSRCSPEEFRWKIFVCENFHYLLCLLFSACHLHGKLLAILNKHIQPSWMQHESAPWTSAAKSMLPRNTKCSTM